MRARTWQPDRTLSKRLAEAIAESGRYEMRRRSGPPRPGELPGVARLAEDAGVGQSTMQRYTSGKRDHDDLRDTLEGLYEVARLLGVSFEWLAVGRGSKRAAAPVLHDEIRRVVREELGAVNDDRERYRTPTPPSGERSSNRPR